MISGHFTIENNEYFGDFDLSLTMNSGQTSQPPWIYDNDKYYEVLKLDDVNVLVEISQEGLNEDVSVNYYSDDDVDTDIIRDKLFHIFDLNYDIIEVYDYLDNNSELKDVYKFNKGLRLFKAQFQYECIISSICSANNSIKRWTKSISDIKRAYGEEVKVNGKKYYLFPKEEVFVPI